MALLYKAETGLWPRMPVKPTVNRPKKEYIMKMIKRCKKDFKGYAMNYKQYARLSKTALKGEQK